jgi:hypothetical protein
MVWTIEDARFPKYKVIVKYEIETRRANGLFGGQDPMFNFTCPATLH